VLPFQNLKGADADDFLGSHWPMPSSPTGLCESAERSLLLRRVAVQHAGARPAKIAADLKVDTLLTGTYLHEGDDLRLSVQLVESNSQRMLWSDTINLKYLNLMTIQDRVARRSCGLQVPLSAPEAARMSQQRSAKADAYEEYLRGVDFYAMNRFEQSIQSLERSAKLDPEYPQTWTMLGRAYTTNASLQFGGPGTTKRRDLPTKMRCASIRPRSSPASTWRTCSRTRGTWKMPYPAAGRLEAESELRRSPLGDELRLPLWRPAGGIGRERGARAPARSERQAQQFRDQRLLYLGRYDEFLASLPRRVRARTSSSIADSPNTISAATPRRSATSTAPTTSTLVPADPGGQGAQP